MKKHSQREGRLLSSTPSAHRIARPESSNVTCDRSDPMKHTVTYIHHSSDTYIVAQIMVSDATQLGHGPSLQL